MHDRAKSFYDGWVCVILGSFQLGWSNSNRRKQLQLLLSGWKPSVPSQLSPSARGDPNRTQSQRRLCIQSLFLWRLWNAFVTHTLPYTFVRIHSLLRTHPDTYNLTLAHTFPHQGRLQSGALPNGMLYPQPPPLFCRYVFHKRHAPLWKPNAPQSDSFWSRACTSHIHTHSTSVQCVSLPKQML